MRLRARRRRAGTLVTLPALAALLLGFGLLRIWATTMASAEATQPASSLVHLDLAADGRLTCDGDPVELAGLGPFLAARGTGEPRVVALSADPHCRGTALREVLSRLQAAGITNLRVTSREARP